MTTGGVSFGKKKNHVDNYEKFLTESNPPKEKENLVKVLAAGGRIWTELDHLRIDL